MKLQLRLLSCLIAVLLAIAPVTVYAASEEVDFNKTGSLKVSIKYEEKDKDLSKGSLTLYPVAELKQADHELYYELLEDYAGFSYEFTSSAAEIDVEDTKLVKELVSYINEKKLKGETLLVDKDGKAYTENLKLGMYLIKQDKPAEGYSSVKPFLIMVPMEVRNQLVYDVVANPKIEVKPTETETETETETPTEHETKPPEKHPHLPKTGQLWWPVPVLAVAGLLSFTIGWKKRYNNR